MEVIEITNSDDKNHARIRAEMVRLQQNHHLAVQRRSNRGLVSILQKFLQQNPLKSHPQKTCQIAGDI